MVTFWMLPLMAIFRNYRPAMILLNINSQFHTILKFKIFKVTDFMLLLEVFFRRYNFSSNQFPPKNISKEWRNMKACVSYLILIKQSNYPKKQKRCGSQKRKKTVVVSVLLAYLIGRAPFRSILTTILLSLDSQCHSPADS